MKSLPQFKTRKYSDVFALVTVVFTHADEPERSFVERLEQHDDHYRVVFRLEYFRSTDDPSKSQWNSVKKKFKRHDKSLFVFKEYGTIPCNAVDDKMDCGYVDFGFFAN